MKAHGIHQNFTMKMVVLQIGKISLGGKNMFDLTGKVALVTGSARGIGAAIAICLGAAGASVAVNYVSENSKAKAENVAAEIRSNGGKAIILRGDVANEDDVIAMISAVDKTFGRLDILCNNAGINSNFNIDTLTLEEWQRIQNVNITGSFLCSKHALPLMRSNHFGRIILISSMVGEQGALFGQLHYASTKGAQLSFAKTLARSVAKEGITVNCIAPGVHMTETLNEILVKSDPHRMDKTVELIPMGKIGTCEDIGFAAVYLSSDEAGYLTGTTIDINGGMYMR